MAAKCLKYHVLYFKIGVHCSGQINWLCCHGNVESYQPKYLLLLNISVQCKFIYTAYKENYGQPISVI